MAMKTRRIISVSNYERSTFARARTGDATAFNKFRNMRAPPSLLSPFVPRTRARSLAWPFLHQSIGLQPISLAKAKTNHPLSLLSQCNMEVGETGLQNRRLVNCCFQSLGT